MDSKLPLYHWLVVLVPGSMFLVVIYFTLQTFSVGVPVLSLGASETVNAFSFLVIALLVGELLQAVGGLIEPILFWTWGGSSSKRLILGGKYKQEIDDLRSKLGGNLTDEGVFERAMAYCNQLLLGRSEYFNTLYAYTRSLFTGAVIVIVITLVLGFPHWRTSLFWCLLLLECVVALTLWHRTKKRGNIFAREVVLQAVLSLKKK